MDKRRQPITCITIIFILCSIVKYIEFLIIRTDQTVLGDNFINKLIGVVIIAISIRSLGYTWRGLGFKIEKLLKGSMIGLTLGVITFTLAYGIEYLILSFQGLAPRFQFYVAGFSLTGNETKNTAITFFALCICFNIINVAMEEGLFRGLFIRLAQRKYGFGASNSISAFFFGIWHLVTPFRSYIDGDFTLTVALVMGFGYVILAGVMSIKWGLWMVITGGIWVGVSEHFFNNAISNLLHVVTVEGADQMQIVRIFFTQMLSLAAVLIINYKTNSNHRFAITEK